MVMPANTPATALTGEQLDELAALARALPDALRFDCVTTMDNGRAMLHALGTQSTHAVASTHAAAYAIQDALRLAFATRALISMVRSQAERIAASEQEAAETDKVLADTLTKWEEMERCAYNICAHCKEPFERGEAMSLHAQECPRNPVVAEVRRLRRGIGYAVDSLAEDELDTSAMRRLGDSDEAIVLAETVSRVIARLRALAGGAAGSGR